MEAFVFVAAGVFGWSQGMQKGENLISVGLAAAVVLTILAIQRKWQPAGFKEVASSAEQFILTAAGIRGQIPDIVGYEKVKTYRLGRFRAGLYRASPAPLIFAFGRFVIYDRSNQPVFKLETLEGSKEPWTVLYDFAGRGGLSVSSKGARPVFTRNLTGNGEPDIVIGQYSGGDRCCTTVTVVELGKEAVKALGRIEGLDGLPFEGLEVRKIDKGPSWEIIGHRSYGTLCGVPAHPADLIAVFAYADGQYTNQTPRFTDYLEGILRQNIAKWSEEKTRSLDLLETLAVEYARVGKPEEGKRFFAMNLPLYVPQLQKSGIDPNACLQDLEGLLDQVVGAGR